VTRRGVLPALWVHILDANVAVDAEAAPPVRQTSIRFDFG
jgi:hypothetical protein